ncbi:copper resistance protein CopC [Marinibaculum pumilum]|uniref:Copper resistance protein CopC n=1 Tax=Marinibaculum pumilum TaxID=1766165 RepID=A0ABV7KWL4_9PROT
MTKRVHAMRRRSRPLLATMLAAAIGLFATAPAFAHARLTSSDPADGAKLSAAPTSARLSFSETVLVTDVSLAGAAGREVETHRESAMRPAAQSEVTFDALPPGDYRLQWRAQSADGHPMSGSIGFTVK